METKQKKITEAELWHLRALTSEKRALSSEATILQYRIEDIDLQLDAFSKTVMEKYGCVNFGLDGSIIYEEVKDGTE